MIWIIILMTFLAGIVQGMTGFGASIVMMMAFPSFFVLTKAAGISTAICLFLNITNVYLYRKYVNFKTILPPTLLYICTCSIVIEMSTKLDGAMMKKVFGVFLIILGIYYLFLNKADKKELSLGVSLICIVVSAICDGLFGIGGPLMVLYYLSKTKGTHEYIGTISTFFCINCIYNTIFRVIRGIITIDLFPYIALGVVCIITGGIIAHKIVDKLNPELLKKLTYVMIVIAGIANII